MTKRSFHKYTITYEVLTEMEIPDGLDNMSGIAYQCEEGDYVGTTKTWEHENIDGAEAAKALTAAGSEPGFFQLTDEGEDEE